MDESARTTDEPFDNSQLPLEEKVELMRQQLEWLCVNVSGMLEAAAKNPMFRMMMKGAK